MKLHILATISFSLPYAFAFQVDDFPCGGGVCPGTGTCCAPDPAPCCPSEGATCCGDGTCCPPDHPVCDGVYCTTADGNSRISKTKNDASPVKEIKDYPCGGGVCPGT